MSEGYKVELKNGEQLFIPDWTPTVALENLTQVGKFLGLDNVLSISKLNDVSIHTAIIALSESEDSTVTMDLIKHFVCSANMDGERILTQSFDTIFSGKLTLIMEIFCHVIHSQYSDFFEQGLIEV